MARRNINQAVVTTSAILFCIAVFVGVIVFTFTQYKSSKERNAALEAQLIEEQTRQLATSTPTPSLIRP
jgi:hypothetical protein